LSYDDDVRTRERRADGRGTATAVPQRWRPDEFVAYWSDRGQPRKSWDATFILRLQRLQANAAKDQDHEP